MTDERVRKQYEALYGTFQQGDYRIGDRVQYARGEGQIIWSCRKDGRFIYVIDGGGWPIELSANEIIQSRG